MLSHRPVALPIGSLVRESGFFKFFHPFHPDAPLFIPYSHFLIFYEELRLLFRLKKPHKGYITGCRLFVKIIN